MEKEYMNKYPTLEKDQFGLNRALIAMLNSRRYLTSQGFQEIFSDDDNGNGIAGGYATIIFSDGSKITNDNFKKAPNRNLLLQEMILRGIKLDPSGSYDDRGRARVITSTFNRDVYKVHFAIKDTTKKKLGFFKGFFHDAEMFSFSYHLTLNQDLIKDSDIEQFEKYRAGLEDAIQQETPLDYAPQIQPRKSSQDSELPKHETQFINPWEVQIPKLGKNV